MCTGADYIDDMNLLRAGGMPTLFDQVYAPSTLGIFLREFTYGHSLQLGAVLRRHLIALAARTPCCRASKGGRSSTSIRCCARSTDTRNRERPTDTPRSPAAPCCAKG